MDALANEWASSMDVIMVWAWLAKGWVGSMDVIMVWAWMHWPMVGLVAWKLSRFVHGCTDHWMGW